MRRPRQPQPPHPVPYGFPPSPTPRRSRRPRAGSPTTTALALGLLVAGIVAGPIVHIAHGAAAESDATAASPTPAAASLDIDSPATVAATRAVRPVRITTVIEHDDVVIPASDAATKDWEALAECESGGDPTIVSRSGRYHGLYQFDLPTWRSVGGEGLPSQAPPDEQTARAMALYDERGAAPWPTCGRRL